jgi:hypothetical protein
MHFTLYNSGGCRDVVSAAVMAVWLATSALAAELMPAPQQNALVQKYCAVCHTDAARNGGLSLEHFDAAQAAPSLTAMLLSKLTGGVLLETVREAPTNASASALVNKKTRSGAMGAAGIPVPDKATIDALIHAFAVESTRATEWTVERSYDAPAGASMLTVSTLREMPSAKNAGEAEAYRLIASCNLATREGEVQLAWSPVAQSGTLAASVDGNAAARYRVEGSEKMGNGSVVVLHGLAALVLADTKRGVSRTGLPFPAESLTISDLFPGETITFSFTDLPKEARREFKACFSGSASSDRLRPAASERSPAGQ